MVAACGVRHTRAARTYLHLAPHLFILRQVLHGINLRLKRGSRYAPRLFPDIHTQHTPTTHLTAPPPPPSNTQHSCLLIGANGAGKSTLLRILGGRHLTKPDEAVTVMGMNAFRDTKLNMIRAYMDTDWGMRTVAFAGAWGALWASGPASVMSFAAIHLPHPIQILHTHTSIGYGVPLQADIPVTGMMSKLQSQHPERRDELIELLGIDPEWRMNRVSDGQVGGWKTSYCGGASG